MLTCELSSSYDLIHGYCAHMAISPSPGQPFGVEDHVMWMKALLKARNWTLS